MMAGRGQSNSHIRVWENERREGEKAAIKVNYFLTDVTRYAPKRPIFVIASRRMRRSNPRTLLPGDCFGKKRLAMTEQAFFCCLRNISF
jgi:hypothetical protein